MSTERLQLPEDGSEIPTVSETLYRQTRETLEQKGYTFVVAISSVSVDQLVTSEGEGSRFSYISPSEPMRSNVPPQIEVAINPNNFRIEGSDRLSTDDQIEKIREQEAVLKGKLPEDVRDLVSMRMPRHASVLVQLDLEYQRRMGRALFTGWFGRTDDNTINGGVAGVGRGVPTSGLSVFAWLRDEGYGRLFAFPVVVLPRKLP